jgi:hypothetical protein
VEVGAAGKDFFASRCRKISGCVAMESAASSFRRAPANRMVRLSDRIEPIEGSAERAQPKVQQAAGERIGLGFELAVDGLDLIFDE